MTYLLLFLSVVVSAAAARALGLEDRLKIRLLTAFGGAYVFTITILHLLPEVFREHKPGVSAFILLGFFIQVFLEYFSHGIEHGHVHHSEKHGMLPKGLMFGLCVHSFLEGMPLGDAGLTFPKEHAHQMLLAGIIMHNVPVSVVLVSMLFQDEVRPAKLWLVVLVFALMSPLGALTSNFSQTLLAYETQLTGLVIGIFLHLSTTILFEASEAHKINRQKIMGIITGAGLAILTASFH
jgi:zinc and cadmium transporter